MKASNRKRFDPAFKARVALAAREEGESLAHSSGSGPERGSLERRSLAKGRRRARPSRV